MINNNVRCITNAGNDAWIGTEFGLSFYDGERFTNYNTPQGLIHHQVNALAREANGNLWIGTAYGLSLFAGNQFFLILILRLDLAMIMCMGGLALISRKTFG